MKDSYFRTPRSLNDCSWSSGYYSGQKESTAEKVAGIGLAIVIGVALALVLFYGLSS
jgi:hypothetical protein